MLFHVLEVFSRLSLAELALVGLDCGVRVVGRTLDSPGCVPGAFCSGSRAGDSFFEVRLERSGGSDQKETIEYNRTTEVWSGVSF